MKILMSVMAIMTWAQLGRADQTRTAAFCAKELNMRLRYTMDGAPSEVFYLTTTQRGTYIVGLLPKTFEGYYLNALKTCTEVDTDCKIIRHLRPTNDNKCVEN